MAKPTLLLVETDILVRHPLAEYLRDCGYDVVEAAGAVEARQFLGNAHSGVAVMLVDVSEAGGFELSRWVRQHHPEIDVLRAGTVSAAIAQAADLCDRPPDLAKPYDPRLVEERIKQLLAARSRKGAA